MFVKEFVFNEVVSYSNFTKKETPSHIFSWILLKLSKFLLCIAKLWYLFLVLDKNSRRQFSISINDSDLQEINLYETSKRAPYIEQTLVVHETPSVTLISLFHFDIILIIKLFYGKYIRANACFPAK